MSAFIDLLSRYAAHHRDQRNIFSHFVGIPLMVLGLGILLARPTFVLGGYSLSPAWLACGVAAAWYLTRGSLTLGIATSISVGAVVLLAQPVARGSLLSWLTWGLGTFSLGWALQHVGHWYEGKKPAYVSDPTAFLIGPMFVTAELLFMLGWNRPALAEIERRAGPPVLRDIARII